MRIIAGELKGSAGSKRPKWDGLRPTSDKLRETLFNVVAPRVPGARVLDLYAGTGAIGIEALSRGAAHVTFVDSDRRARASSSKRTCALRRPRPLCYYPNAAITAGRIVRSGRAGSALRRTRSDGRDCRGRAPDCARRTACSRARAAPAGAGAGRTAAHDRGIWYRETARWHFTSQGASRQT